MNRLFSGLKWHGAQVFKGFSRLMNALTGGEGDTTFSAYSWHLMMNGESRLSRQWGVLRSDAVDWIFGDGHCLRAYEWHKRKGLFEIDKVTGEY